MKKQKYKISYIAFIVYSLSFIIVFAGCAKVTTTRTDTSSDASTQAATASDEAQVNSEFSQVVDDAVTVLSNHKANITGTYIDTSGISNGVIYIAYGGLEADGTKSRSGSDSIHFKGIWGTPEATATLTLNSLMYLAYEVTYYPVSNNNQLAFTGTTATIENVSGNYLQNVTSSDSMVVHVRGKVVFSFNDNAASAVQWFNWTINNLRSFKLVDTNMMATTYGDTTINGVSNVCTSGTTRTGYPFYTVMLSPVVQNISYPYYSYNPLSGIKYIQEIPQPIYMYFGVNSQGVPVTGKPYGFRINWNNSGTASADIIPYYY